MSTAGRARAVVAFGLVVALALTIGMSLVGLRSFHGADIMESFTPWRSLPPDGVVPTNPLVGDTVDSIMPEKSVMRAALADGVPTWNPYQLGGTPSASIRNAGVYSVLNLPYWILPLWYAPGASKVLEFVAAIGFTALFLRLHGMTTASGILGGMVFAFSGFQVAWNNWHQAHVGALVAGLFFSIELVVRKRKVVWGIPLVGVVATMWFEGFPSVTGYGLFFGGIYALARTLEIPTIREKATKLVILGGGVALGTAMAAVQLLPFGASLAAQDLSTRVQQSGIHLPVRTLATVFVPNAFGSPVDRNYFGPINYIEIQSFVGIAAVVLAVVSIVHGRKLVSRATYWYFVVATAFAGMLMWFGGPVLALLQETPLFGLNFIGRLRSVFGFLVAVLAGIGFEVIIRSLLARSTRRERALLVAALVAVGLGASYVLFRAWQMAVANLEEPYFVQRLLVAGFVALVVIVALVAALVRDGRAHHMAAVTFPLIVVFEVTVFAMPFWPQIPVEEFYPWTDAHEFVVSQIGDGRLAVAGLAFYPSTTMLYGIRSVTGHTFHDPAWQDMLTAIDPDVMSQSPTFSILASTPDIGSSPVLDRLAARYFAADQRVAIAGDRQRIGEPVDTVELSSGFTMTGPAMGTTRGIGLILETGYDPGENPDSFVLEVLDANGTPIASGLRRMDKYIFEGPLFIAVPEADDGTAFRLTFAGDTPIRLGATARGDVAYDHFTAADDGLHLAYADAVVLYERTNALDRVRWAASGVVVDDPDERLAMLAEGVAADTVVLSAEGTRGSGSEARLTITRDEGSAIDVSVSAAGAGYVVVADTIQRNWVARLSGVEVPVVPADHALGAVAVPAGEHILELRYEAPNLAVGAAVSLLAVLISMGILAATVMRARSSRRPGMRRSGESDGTA